MRGWLNRHLLLADFALSSLGRHGTRYFALLAVYAGIVFVLASSALFTHAVTQESQKLLAHSPEVLVQKLKAGRHAYLTEAELETFGEIRGVSRIEGRRWGYLYDPVASSNYTLMASTLMPLEPGQIAIGDGVAGVRGVVAGDALSFRSAAGELHTFTVARVFAGESSLIAADLVLMNVEDWRIFFGLPGDVYTDAALSVRNPLEVATIARKIAERIPESRVISREELRRTYASLFEWREGFLLVLAGLAASAFAILAWNQATGLSGTERHEIGILKAIGWETRDLLTMKLWEGGLISGGAFVIGFLLAWIHVFHFDAGLIAPVLKGWSVLYPRFVLTPSIDVQGVLSLVLLTVLPYTLATLVPAWKAAITDPDLVMRGTE